LACCGEFYIPDGIYWSGKYNLNPITMIKEGTKAVKTVIS
jgi:hypothetical protein